MPILLRAEAERLDGRAKERRERMTLRVCRQRKRAVYCPLHGNLDATSEQNYMGASSSSLFSHHSTPDRQDGIGHGGVSVCLFITSENRVNLFHSVGLISLCVSRVSLNPNHLKVINGASAWLF